MMDRCLLKIYEICELVPNMVKRVKKRLSDGIDLRIFTARVLHTGKDNIKAILAIAAGCFEPIGEVFSIICVKDYNMIELLDDKCVQAIIDMGEEVA